MSGEYAVLFGGVARVLAVGPRVRAFVRRRPDRKVHLLLDEGRLTGDATPLGARWESEPSPAFRFVARTVDLALRALAQDVTGFSIAFEPSPTHGGLKLGFGSSARACVLAAEACRAALGATFDALKLALVAHASAQGGKGSGADVAACFAGDLVRYRRCDVTTLIEAGNKGGFGGALAEAPPVDVWRVSPPRLPMLYVFSGSSASTPSLVSAVEQRLDSAARARFVTQSDALGAALEDASSRADFITTRSAVTELQALLSAQTGTQTEALERIFALANAAGCVAKQSGAGGGDGAIVFAPDVAARDTLQASAQARGLMTVPLEVERGVRGEVVPSTQLVSWSDAAP